MNFGSIKDEDIQALADGQLEAEKAREIYGRVMSDPCARRRYMELVNQNEVLISWWRNYKN